MCIRDRLSDQELLDIMKETRGGSTLKVVESNGKYASVKDMARAFVLYGFLAEMFARETGFSRGLGGSMHAFFIPFGIYPNNAIVGGSADIATVSYTHLIRTRKRCANALKALRRKRAGAELKLIFWNPLL